MANLKRLRITVRSLTRDMKLVLALAATLLLGALVMEGELDVFLEQSAKRSSMRHTESMMDEPSFSFHEIWSEFADDSSVAGAHRTFPEYIRRNDLALR